MVLKKVVYVVVDTDSDPCVPYAVFYDRQKAIEIAETCARELSEGDPEEFEDQTHLCRGLECCFKYDCEEHVITVCECTIEDEDQ